MNVLPDQNSKRKVHTPEDEVCKPRPHLPPPHLREQQGTTEGRQHSLNHAVLLLGNSDSADPLLGEETIFTGLRQLSTVDTFLLSLSLLEPHLVGKPWLDFPA